MSDLSLAKSLNFFAHVYHAFEFYVSLKPLKVSNPAFSGSKFWLLKSSSSFLRMISLFINWLEGSAFGKLAFFKLLMCFSTFYLNWLLILTRDLKGMVLSALIGLSTELLNWGNVVAIFGCSQGYLCMKVGVVGTKLGSRRPLISFTWVDSSLFSESGDFGFD